MDKLLVALLLTACTVSPACAADKAPALRIGANAPNWRNLPGIDGKTHSLSDYRDAKVLVVSFVCTGCPCVQAVEPRVKSFVDRSREHGVQFVAINSNLETLDDMRVAARDRRYNFHYLLDASQNVCHSHGATNTPHVFVFDQNRKLVYSGAFDNGRHAPRATEHFVIDAVNAVLRNRKVPLAHGRLFGCEIPHED